MPHPKTVLVSRDPESCLRFCRNYIHESCATKSSRGAYIEGKKFEKIKKITSQVIPTLLIQTWFQNGRHDVRCGPEEKIWQENRGPMSCSILLCYVHKFICSASLSPSSTAPFRSLICLTWPRSLKNQHGPKSYQTSLNPPTAKKAVTQSSQPERQRERERERDGNAKSR